MLASDLQNPEFAGATNPDSALHVEFRYDKLLNEYRSQQEGRPVYDWMDCIRIQVPGNNLTVIDRPAHSGDKHRFPLHWARYEQSKETPGQVEGTPIDQWALIGRDQAETLRYNKFFTVEAIANASDQMITRIGMGAGMDPYSLRKKAQAYLQAAKATAEGVNREDELRERDEKIAKQQEMLEAMQAQLAELTAQKRGPGRPPNKDKEAA
jgi:hypothetical protein